MGNSGAIVSRPVGDVAFPSPGHLPSAFGRMQKGGTPMGIPGPSSLARSLTRPPSPSHWRRQTMLPPGAPIVVPAGVPLVWDARLALARLWQVYRQVIQAPTLPDGYRWRSQPMPAV